MKRDEKISKSFSWVKSAVKWGVILFITMALFIGFSALLMAHSDGVLTILSSVRHHRFMWLGIRGVIYGICAIYLYRIYHLAKNEEDKRAYRRLIRAVVILFSTIELLQAFRG
ncbi:hypothetical protein BKK56_11075 [Rodentibacter genomosp. 2]|uniref:hypothetical protein n=1 Tax=Rodentibacter genomosp. 2 TaxID=1908266 RepID=UPI0009841E84|nr:hypothetical protein BKK56_11075 [Rodentibacter genomosp. 2]